MRLAASNPASHPSENDPMVTLLLNDYRRRDLDEELVSLIDLDFEPFEDDEPQDSDLTESGDVPH